MRICLRVSRDCPHDRQWSPNSNQTSSRVFPPGRGGRRFRVVCFRKTVTPQGLREPHAGQTTCRPLLLGLCRTSTPSELHLEQGRIFRSCSNSSKVMGPSQCIFAFERQG